MYDVRFESLRALRGGCEALAERNQPIDDLRFTIDDSLVRRLTPRGCEAEGGAELLEQRVGLVMKRRCGLRCRFNGCRFGMARGE